MVNFGHNRGPKLDEVRLGETLKQRRLELKLTHAELAEKVYGSPDRKSHISRIENGKLPGVSLVTIDRLAVALDLQPAQLTGNFEQQNEEVGSSGASRTADALARTLHDQAREYGIKEGMLIALARRYAEGTPDDFDAALAGLSRALEVAHEERERGQVRPNLSDAIDAMIEKIDALNESGELDAAAQIIDEELAAMAAEDEARAQKRLRLFEKGIAQATLNRDVEAAARNTLAKLDYEYASKTDETFNANRSIWQAWFKRGRDKGLNFDLAVSLALAEERVKRSAGPDQLGVSLDDLGQTLQTLGEREVEPSRLYQAVATFREALKLRTRDRVPLEWGQTQNNLGSALRSLGERESIASLLNEAVSAYRDALTELTRDRSPLLWAITQNNIGSALRVLGERESEESHLHEAVSAYRDALRELKRDLVPLHWAMTQNNLGSALGSLGERGSDTSYLQEAISAYRNALNEIARDRFPLDWANIQNNLGTAHRAFAERESDTDSAHAAVLSYRSALLERTRDRVPLDWATTTANLGNALQILGEREGDTARLNEAVSAYQDALMELPRDRVPLAWATAKNNLGRALQTLGEQKGKPGLLYDAISAYRGALSERTRDSVPFDWAMTQIDLGNALRWLGKLECNTAHLHDAQTAYREALKELEQERAPFAWAMTQDNLARLLKSWADLETDEAAPARLSSALSAANEALPVYRPDHTPYNFDKATKLRADILAALDALPEPPP